MVKWWGVVTKNMASKLEADPEGYLVNPGTGHGDGHESHDPEHPDSAGTGRTGGVYGGRYEKDGFSPLPGRFPEEGCGNGAHGTPAGAGGLSGPGTSL